MYVHVLFHYINLSICASVFELMVCDRLISLEYWPGHLSPTCDELFSN